MDKFLEKTQGFFNNNLSVILMFVAVLVIGISIAKIITNILKKIMYKTNIEHTAVTFLLSLIKVLLYLIVAITALSTIGVNVTSLITAVGAAALTAGLALQDSLSNMVSGIIILFNTLAKNIKSSGIFSIP